jgi:hypothetical protein
MTATSGVSRRISSTQYIVKSLTNVEKIRSSSASVPFLWLEELATSGRECNPLGPQMG